MLESVSGLAEANAALPDYIDYTLTGVTETTTTIAANGGTNTATVTVTWDPASNPVTTGATKTATITLNYAQDTP